MDIIQYIQIQTTSQCTYFRFYTKGGFLIIYTVHYVTLIPLCHVSSLSVMSSLPFSFLSVYFFYPI